MTRMQAGSLRSLEPDGSDRGGTYGVVQEARQYPFSKASLTRSATEWTLL
jgi:hypothetical protein